MEILVVLAIIAIVTAGVVLSLNFSGGNSALDTAARRLVTLLRYTRSQAQLQTRNYGILFSPHGYRFLVFSTERNQWRAVARAEVLRPRRLPTDVSLGVRLEGRPIVLHRRRRKHPGALTPQVMIYSSGDLSSFSITLERKGTHHGFVIKPNADGRITERPLTGAAH
jgi:type II secretion system protein H